MNDTSGEFGLVKSAWAVSQLADVTAALHLVEAKQRQLEEKLEGPRSSENRDQQLERFYSSMAMRLDQLHEFSVNVTLNMAMLDKLEASHNTMYASLELIAGQNEVQVAQVQSSVNQLQSNLTQIQIQADWIRQQQVRNDCVLFIDRNLHKNRKIRSGLLI